MASLRTLLDYTDPSGVPPATYVGENVHQIIFRGNHCWSYNSAEQYGWNCFNWPVPNTCVCRIRFELWGGGGGGSGACCCSAGIPAQSGQYAECTVCASSVSATSLDGFLYCIYVGSGTCRTPSQNSGYDGCKSYVTGCGLNNFCACGGCHGGSVCFASFCGMRPITDVASSASSCRWQTDKFARPDSSSYRATQSLCEAAGKDFWGGGMSYQHSEVNNGDCCWLKVYTPYGPRLNAGVVGAKFGALVAQRHPSIANCGRDMTLWNTGNNGGMSSDCNRNGPPGMGGQSASVYGGGCCCGSEGAHGLVKITWFCKI